MADLGVVKGLIELQDNFTSEIGLAEAALSNFTKENQESLKAVAGAAGLLGAALTAVAVAAVELGKRGTDVQNVDNTLEHFAGSAKAANDIMEQLRQGTKGTVDNFALAKDAAHLLSAGVKLTAEDFGTLGQAALVLQHRGLGGTKEQMDLVSDALVTGRTRALAMSLGVIDVQNAEERYAKSLGITKGELSQTGIAEAKRLAIMELLRRAVADAGTQERTFGEQLEVARATMENWMDDLSKAVANSPVLAAGMKAIGEAFHNAFGGDNSGLITSIVHGIEEAAVIATDFGIAAVEVARVFNVAWSGIKVAVLATETILTTFADIVLSAFSAVAHGLASISGDEQVKKQAQQISDLRDQVRGMSDDLSKQTAEAMRGVVGQSEFDKTLDKVGGTLMNVRDAMKLAQNATAEGNKTNNEASDILKRRAAFENQVKQEMIDREKVETRLWTIEDKSLQDTGKLWEEYFQVRSKHSMDATQSQKLAIEQWRNDEVDKLDASDRNWKQHYDAIQAVASEKLKDIDVDWQTVQSKSIDSLQHLADVQRNTYIEMAGNASHYTREALQEQADKMREAQQAVRGLGADTVAAMNAAAAATQTQNDKLAAQKKAAEEAAAANRALGGSFTYDLSTQEGIDQYKKMNPAANITWSDAQIMEYAKKGGSLEGLIKSGVINPYGNMAHFAEGGTVDVVTGEHGPEVVRVPLGSTFYPSGMKPPNSGGGGDRITQNYYVNGTGMDVYRQVKELMIRDLKQSRQFGAA